MVAIEPGTEHGKIIRIHGKGVADIHEGMGSLVVNIKIRIPKIRGVCKNSFRVAGYKYINYS
jgi:DnaJ-class molecular chaperone